MLMRVLQRVRQALCALAGHDLLLRFETNRLSLQCASCCWNSPGWNISGSRAIQHPGAATAGRPRPLRVISRARATDDTRAADRQRGCERRTEAA
jgi:hypothetical protein